MHRPRPARRGRLQQQHRRQLVHQQRLLQSPDGGHQIHHHLEVRQNRRRSQGEHPPEVRPRHHLHRRTRGGHRREDPDAHYHHRMPNCRLASAEASARKSEREAAARARVSQLLRFLQVSEADSPLVPLASRPDSDPLTGHLPARASGQSKACLHWRAVGWKSVKGNQTRAWVGRRRASRGAVVKGGGWSEWSGG